MAAIDHQKAVALQEKINRILWGKTIARVANGAGEINLFVLRSLTIKETNFLDYVYNRELDDALKSGMMLEEELAQTYERHGYWTADDDTYLRGLAMKLRILGQKLETYQFMTTKKNKIEKEIEEVEREIKSKEDCKNALFMLSAENRADEIRRRHLIFAATETMDEEPYWTDRESFLDDDDLTLVYNLTIAYYRENVFDTKETREIARSGLWRYRWNIAKHGADLFGKPISEWSEMQNTLSYWSSFYDGVFDAYERPPESVIDDDVACDAWYEDQNRKNTPKGDDKKNLLGMKKAKTGKFHQEVFVMVEKGDSEAVEKVQSMNTADTRAMLRKEHDKIKKSKGRISEWELRKQQYSSGRL